MLGGTLSFLTATSDIAHVNTQKPQLPKRVKPWSGGAHCRIGVPSPIAKNIYMICMPVHAHVYEYIYIYIYTVYIHTYIDTSVCAHHIHDTCLLNTGPLRGSAAGHLHTFQGPEPNGSKGRSCPGVRWLQKPRKRPEKTDRRVQKCLPCSGRRLWI